MPEAGDVWEAPPGGQEFFGNLKLNAGVEISPVFTLSALIDTTLPITIGYARNITSGGGGEFYLRLDTPLTIFSSIFAY